MDPSSLGWIDAAALLGVLVSIVIGVWRGLVFELMSLAGWIVAFWVAQRWGSAAAAWLPVGAPGSALNLMAGMVLLFVAVLFGWALLSWGLQKLVHASPVRPVDRVLGGVFGIVRALLIGLVLVTLAQLTPLTRSTDWQASRVAQGLTAVLAHIQPWLPDALARHLRAAPDPSPVPTKG